ncbi:inositol hexakisphosphate and diphosphoinositol-pentakisphosphate kinase isoform X3 [Tetranychus urticae]|nr:inositol hexakisphosphate and diphosphoinositol-pentakisphosphate kinase isoform X3 [Tetranychus urticae]XP_025018547.1 inositol hexakisphosphate and diphosphoinositol-pentakisphosphate kinase isoform X3 [Tetranychus urticae]XP_025018548.1 inositol hexakisphosphate and diphosphoinositol-pentakisphosphate kinase isoform X3 [Tetranychus urticae]
MFRQQRLSSKEPGENHDDSCHDSRSCCSSPDMDTASTDKDERPIKVNKVKVGVCAMSKKSSCKPMREILNRLEEFEYIQTIIFPEETILKEPVEKWPECDCLISFFSKDFPLAKAVEYAKFRKPFLINELHMQYDMQDRRKVYRKLEEAGIALPRYAVLDRDSPNPEEREIIECEDHIEIKGEVFNKPFVEKPISAEDHNIYIYYPTSAGGGSQRLFRKIGNRSSVYSPESSIRKTGSYIYEEFMPTDGTDIKVYTVGPDYAHAEARKSPALDGKVERDKDGKEIRYPIILSNAEKLIARKVCLAFEQTVCGFDLLRANGKSYVCDVNGFTFVKSSIKYYDDCAKILGNMVLRNLAPQLHIPWSIPFQLDDPPIVPTTFGKMMELRCVIAVIRHGDRTPKQKMKMEVKHPKFFEIFEKYDGHKSGHIKLKKPNQLQEILDISRYLLHEIEKNPDFDMEENKSKIEQLKQVLEMYGHFSGINRKVELKYQPKGRPRRSSSEEDLPREPSLVLILKWGGELTPAGRVQAEELGRVFRCMYPGGQGEYAGTQGLGLLRLHSTFRHDLKIYASDEGRVQMTAAAFAKGLLALEGELAPILVQMVKSANTNGLLDNDSDSSKFKNIVKQRLHECLQRDSDFTEEDLAILNPTWSRSIQNALNFIKNPFRACEHVYELVQELNSLIKQHRESFQSQESDLYHGETWDLMQRRWAKLEKDFKLKNGKFDISKVPDIYDCIKYDLQHNQHILQFSNAEELYTYSKALADVVIPQEYGITKPEKLTIGLGICSPLLKKIRGDLLRDYLSEENETVNRLNPHYSHGVSSPGRHVRTRLYFTSESHIHSLLSVLHYGGLIDDKDEQWRRAMEYVSTVSELNYMTQIVIMLYEDPTKDPSSEDRFHIELHFSPGVVCCVQKNIPKGPGFRPQSRNTLSKKFSDHNAHSSNMPIKEEDSDELTVDDDELDDYQSPISSTNACSTPESPTILEEGKPHSLHHDFKFTELLEEDERLEKEKLSSPPPSSSDDSNLLLPDTKSKSESCEDLPVNCTETNQSANTIANKTVSTTTDTTPISIISTSTTTSIINTTTSLAFSTPTNSTNSHNSSINSQIDATQNSLESKAESTPKVLLRSNSMSVSFSCPNSSVPMRHKPLAKLKQEIMSSHAQSLDNVCESSKTLGRNKPHRHSIHGQSSSYLRLCSVADLPHYGSASSLLFSTAVISGSSSAPELKDVLHPPSEGIPNIPSIRPLETLHNALSLKQLVAFLERMTATGNRSANTSPSFLAQMSSNGSSTSFSANSLPMLSPTSSFGCSGPSSIVSSSGQSSPNS